LVLTALSLVSSTAFAGDFTFRAPEGWTNVSPDAPASEVAKAPAQLVSDVHSRGFVFYAADLRTSDTFMENVSATVYPGGRRITQGFLDGTVAEMADASRKSVPSYRLIDKRLASLKGITVGRILSELEVNHVKVRSLAYLIPGPKSFAMLTYTTAADDFGRYEPALEAAAQATTGVGDPTSLQISTLMVGGFAGALAALIAAKLKARKKKASSS
jgi:hypothetical protein